MHALNWLAANRSEPGGMDIAPGATLLAVALNGLSDLSLLPRTSIGKGTRRKGRPVVPYCWQRVEIREGKKFSQGPVPTGYLLLLISRWNA